MPSKAGARRYQFCDGLDFVLHTKSRKSAENYWPFAKAARRLEKNNAQLEVGVPQSVSELGWLTAGRRCGQWREVAPSSIIGALCFEVLYYPAQRIHLARQPDDEADFAEPPFQGGPGLAAISAAIELTKA
jgi:hypothetical protein